MRIFDLPLLAVASVDDVLWETLKRPGVVGPQHLCPTESVPGARSVITCFLPFTERIGAADRAKGWPATEWLYGRYEGAAFVDVMCGFLAELVERAGGRAVAPVWTRDLRLSICAVTGRSVTRLSSQV